MALCRFTVAAGLPVRRGGLAAGENSPDDSSLNRTRLRIDLETHQAMFDWVLKRLAEHELLKGKTLGVDASTLEANAAMRSIVRRETGQSAAADIGSF